MLAAATFGPAFFRFAQKQKQAFGCEPRGSFPGLLKTKRIFHIRKTCATTYGAGCVNTLGCRASYQRQFDDVN